MTIRILAGLAAAWMAAGTSSAQTVRVGGFMFSAGSEPVLPSGWSSDESRPGTHLYVVSFPDRIRAPWREALLRHARILSYLPDNAFLVSADRPSIAAVRSERLASFVQPYHPAYKVIDDLQTIAFTPNTAAAAAVRITTADGAQQATLVRDLSLRRVEILSGHRPEELGIATSVVVNLATSDLATLAADPRVLWLERALPAEIANYTAGVVLRTRTASASANSLGLTGNGEMIAVADTGLGDGAVPNRHVDFNDTAAYGGITPKVFGIVQALAGLGCTGADNCGHGTHVAGTTCGTGLGSGIGTGYEMKGEAYNAQLFFQDLAPPACGLNCIPSDLNVLFAQAYNASSRCRVHSDSWGQPGANFYTGFARNVDQFVADNGHGDFVACFAAGNSGPNGGNGATVISPSTAKDVISVGGCYNMHGPQCTAIPPPLGTVVCVPSATPDNLAPFASWGPCADGRLKPDIVAPADAVSSCQFDTTNGYGCWCGTSMATPNIAGFCALLREYFKTQAVPTHNPSFSLIKATLLNGGYWSAGSTYHNNNWGYGRADMMQSLSPPAPSTWLWEDEQFPLACGQSTTFTIEVTDATVPFRMTLIWADVAAAVGASPALVNDLDLTVTTPNATVYQGNHIPASQGKVTLPDRLNSTEQVWVKPGDAGFGAGTWTITVGAVNVPIATQKYSWVASFGQAPGTTPTATVTPGGPIPTATTVQATCSPSLTRTRTNTFTSSATHTVSPTTTPSYTASSTVTATPTNKIPGQVVVVPNPVSGSDDQSHVHFAGVPAEAVIDVFNVAGERLARLSSDGTPNLVWEAGAYSRGVYAYRVTWPGGVSEGRFALVP